MNETPIIYSNLSYQTKFRLNEINEIKFLCSYFDFLILAKKY